AAHRARGLTRVGRHGPAAARPGVTGVTSAWARPRDERHPVRPPTAGEYGQVASTPPTPSESAKEPAVKKLINDPADVVPESVEGFVQAHADIVTASGDPESLFVARAGGAVSGKVGLVSEIGRAHV